MYEDSNFSHCTNMSYFLLKTIIETLADELWYFIVVLTCISPLIDAGHHSMSLLAICVSLEKSIQVLFFNLYFLNFKCSLYVLDARAI